MDRAELTALLTTDGLRLVDEVGPIQTPADVLRVVTQLRKDGHGPDLVSAVVSQARLRTRGRAKFGPFADRMLFTHAGLEQATRLSVAAQHAGRFRAADIGAVADLGCGIGGDAMGFAGIGMIVEAVDADEVTAAVAAYNLAPFGAEVSVRCARAEDVDLSLAQGVWLDPARRAEKDGSSRRVSVADYSPPLEWALGIAASYPTGIKLSPGQDRALIPAGVEAQWVSVDGSTVEMVLWSGALARPGVRRAALVIRGDRAHELTAAADSEDAPERPLGEYLHEPDGAVIRSRQIGTIARALGAGMLTPGIAYLTGDDDITNPFVSSFRVIDQLPADEGKLARALRERGVGTLEIKKRGVDIDPARLRTRLKLRGPESATVIITRIGATRTALLVERRERDPATPAG